MDDDVSDYVIDIKQATTQVRDSQVVTASVALATTAASSGVVEVSTTVDPHDSHDAVTSSHGTHDDAPPSHHDKSSTDDHAAADDATTESTPADEPAHVEVAVETHDAVPDSPTDQQG
jgi:hypothetical protein